MLSENWKDYDSFNAIHNVSGRSIDGNRTAIHSAGGWWLLWNAGEPYLWGHDDYPATARREDMGEIHWYINVLDCIKSGQARAPKFKNFATLIRWLDRDLDGAK